MSPLPCTRVVSYYACGCKKDDLSICQPRCSHSAPVLSVRLIPVGCNSPQITRKRPQYQARPKVRTEACTMDNPEMKGFIREEDTAGSELHFTLEGFEGLGTILERVIPPFVLGNYEDEIRLRYTIAKGLIEAPVCSFVPLVEQQQYELAGAGVVRPVSPPGHYCPFKLEAVPATVRRNVGVIGDGRKFARSKALSSGKQLSDHDDDLVSFTGEQRELPMTISDLLEGSTPDEDDSDEDDPDDEIDELEPVHKAAKCYKSPSQYNRSGNTPEPLFKRTIKPWLPEGWGGQDVVAAYPIKDRLCTLGMYDRDFDVWGGAQWSSRSHEDNIWQVSDDDLPFHNFEQEAAVEEFRQIWGTNGPASGSLARVPLFGSRVA